MHTEKEKWLRQMGVSYMIGHDMQPFSFSIIQLVMGMCFILVLCCSVQLRIEVWSAVLVGGAFLCGYWIPVLMIQLSNKMDNDAMLDDIKSIYNTLKIQMKAGVYVSDVLAECYLIVRNKRLKNALRELSNEIFTKHDLLQALERFNGKFKNIYVDMLTMVLEQSLQSGRSVQMLQDLSQQIQEVEHALYIKAKKKAENQVLAFQLAIYFGILMVVIFAMYHELIQAFN